MCDNACNFCRHCCIYAGSVVNQCSVMKHICISIFAVIISVCPLLAQDADSLNSKSNKFPFAIKAYPFRGMYLDKGVHWDKFVDGNGIPASPAGLHMGFELPSTGQRPWQQYLGNPTVGVGVSWLDFGHKMLGHGVAIYPYILLDAIDTEYFQMRFKIAGGPSVVTEHWYTQADQNPGHYYEPTVNTIFGCYINAYLNAGVNLNVPITRYLAFGGEFGFFHMSNGRTCMPNIGVNALYGSVGVTATFNSDVEKKPVRFPDQPYGWVLNVSGAAGAQKPGIEDQRRYLISTLHAGAVYHVNNWYGVGLGLDVFFNGAVSKYTHRSLYCGGEYDIDDVIVDCTTCGSEKGKDYTFAKKTRAALALNNEFKFGAVTAILDWGVYFYNPARNIYFDYHRDNHGSVAPKRPLFYKSPYGAGAEEAFHYFRLGAKCRIWDNLYIQTTMKCHLHIAEYIEFGLGYQIPFLKKENRKEGQSIVFHHRKNWWKE